MNFFIKIAGFVLLLTSTLASAQEGKIDTVSMNEFSRPDHKYLEDQIFFQFSYITLKNLYPDLKQQGFSNSLSFGYIRDLPVNLRRNIGFGIGIGFERNVYFQNLRVKVDEQTGRISYEILDEGTYRLNAFGIKRLVFPVEFRLRGSTATKFKFWRVYTGVTLGYVLGAFAEYENDYVSVKYKYLGMIPSKFQYGIHLYAGYADLNGYIYFGLNDLFSPEVHINDTHIPMQDIRFGVMLSFL
jgi:hypothetical protein